MSHPNTVAYTAGAVCCRSQRDVRCHEARGDRATWWVQRAVETADVKPPDRDIPMIYRSATEKAWFLTHEPERYFAICRAQRHAEVREQPIPGDDECDRLAFSAPKVTPKRPRLSIGGLLRRWTR